jgi:hypothetical protein
VHKRRPDARDAVDAGRLKRDEKLSTLAVITVDGLDLR